MRDVSSARADVGSPRHDVVHDQMDIPILADERSWREGCDFMGAFFFALFLFLGVGSAIWGW